MTKTKLVLGRETYGNKPVTQVFFDAFSMYFDEADTLKVNFPTYIHVPTPAEGCEQL